MADNIGVRPSTTTGSVNVATWEDSDGINWPAYLDAAHAKIHQGLSFQATYISGEGNNVADNAAIDVLIQSTAGIHLIQAAATGGDAEVFLYRNPTFSAAGTNLTQINKNEYSSNTSAVTITHTPTLSDDGVLMASKFVPGGTGGNSTGGADGSFDREIILNHAHTYLFRVINRAGTAQPIGVTFEWYELTL